MSYIYIMSLVDINEVPEEARPFLKDSKHGPHCTLLFLGKIPEGANTGDVKEVLENVAEEVLFSWNDIDEEVHGEVDCDLSGTFGGLGRFSGSESSENKDVFYLSVDSPNLFDFRNMIKEAVEQYGDLELDSSHGFVPHTTLKFLLPDEPTPLHRINTSKVDLNRIRVVVGKEFMDFHAVLGEVSEWRTFPD